MSDPNQSENNPSKSAETVPISSTVTPNTTEVPMENWDIVKKNITVMFGYATKRGLSLPNSLNTDEIETKETILDTYNALIQTIAPATPASIKYIKQNLTHDDEELKWYQIPIFTKCIVISMIALVSMIGISLSPVVNETNQTDGLLNSHGWVLFYNLVFVCSASLIGVMFYLLKTISNKIKNYTLLKVDALEINATIIIGVISGFIIAELFTFSISQFAGDKVEIQKMTLALLGGFSSDAIFTIIQNFVNRIKSIFSTE